MSSEQIDSHGDNVSNDSVRDNIDCRGLTCGAYELLLIAISVAMPLPRAGEPSSMSVPVSVIEFNCVVDTAKSMKKRFKCRLRNMVSMIDIYHDFCR